MALATRVNRAMRRRIERGSVEARGFGSGLGFSLGFGLSLPLGIGQEGVDAVSVAASPLQRWGCGVLRLWEVALVVRLSSPVSWIMGSVGGVWGWTRRVSVPQGTRCGSVGRGICPSWQRSPSWASWGLGSVPCLGFLALGSGVVALAA